ncbi:MAG TPA: Zn-ribbon domain-containing OB-fold protein [Ktedonobacteraceae bacterium]|jgi:hypothetical protein|nr:Zn-ribbon domain-containing OB-fold protein [Ktedonobacteraceae bacterium]
MPAHIPQPLVDGDSRPYWEGLARGELLIQRCDACSRYVFYPRSICPHCFADQLSWVAASGNGTIYAYTVVHQAYGPFADGVPFVIAIVELEEGVRMMTRIVDAQRERVAVGVAVRVTFAPVDEGLTLPYFQLVE